MKMLIFSILSFVFVCINAQVVPIEFPKHEIVKPIENLISRFLGPWYLSQFILESVEKTKDGMDVLEVGMKDDRIRLAGSSATALASALQWYLKKIGKTQSDWYGHPLILSENLPSVEHPFRMERSTLVSYYLNVCTVSYSMWSWQWPQWENHLDWMAMNGINMPLAFTGQEKVWQETFAHFNVSQHGISQFFTGAAFLAWGRMGNVRGSWGVGNALPQSFIENQFELQNKILARMKEMGMVPAMPAFAGHVPAEMHQLFPKTTMTRSSKWCEFPDKNCCVYAVEPTEDLFIEIGATFIQKLHEIYPNASSIYQCDTYNEMSPPSWKLSYLESSSKAVVKSIQKGDEKGVWLMQGWLFQSSEWTSERIEAYLTGASQTEMIILDLYSESRPIWNKTSNYFGKFWIYCVLHDFGGNLGLRGDLPTIASDTISSQEASNGTMIGLGLTMEGIFQNYIVYDLTLEMAWRSKKIDIHAWLPSYIEHRYHSKNEHLLKAWTILAASVYNCTNGYGGVTKSIVTLRPQWNMDEHDSFMPTALAYNASLLFEAWEYMLQAASLDKDIATNSVFQHDLVDLTRQILSDRVLVEMEMVQHLYLANDTCTTELICSKSDALLKTILDMDRILSSNKNYLLGRWLQDAKDMANTNNTGANTDKLKSYYEYQGRNQITKWGENNRNELSDYAGKQWGGLVQSYYHPRWTFFLNDVCASKRQGRDLNTTEIDRKTETFELEWQLQHDVFSTEPIGNTVEISTRLFHQYGKKGVLKNNVFDMNDVENLVNAVIE